MSDVTQDIDLLARQICDHETNWSLGTFGAIAEFAREPDEAVAVSRGDASIAVVTARGGIRIEWQKDMRLFASETTTRDSWNHRIALCLRTTRCAMNRRTAFTELGNDSEALQGRDREATLFDLGLGALQADLCVRVTDPHVAAELRPHVGRALFEPGNSAMAVILAASPHRVFVSRVGRIEVFQPIPAANGESPQGPHTHVLPKLLRHQRTHSATEAVPDGWIPCAHLYPAHAGQVRKAPRLRRFASHGLPKHFAGLWRSRILRPQAAGDCVRGRGRSSDRCSNSERPLRADNCSRDAATARGGEGRFTFPDVVARGSRTCRSSRWGRARFRSWLTSQRLPIWRHPRYLSNR